jgi:hypothetical protein
LVGEFGVGGVFVEGVHALDFVKKIFEGGFGVSVGADNEVVDEGGVHDGEFDIALEEKGEVVNDGEAERVLREKGDFVGFGLVGDDAVFVSLLGLEETGEVGVGALRRGGNVFDVEMVREGVEEFGAFDEAGVYDGVREGFACLEVRRPLFFDLFDVEEAGFKDDFLYALIVVFKHGKGCFGK